VVDRRKSVRKVTVEDSNKGSNDTYHKVSALVTKELTELSYEV
jgi:hypothetical protein